MDLFFGFFGMGAVVGLAYTTIRYGIPIILSFICLIPEALRQVVVGFRAGWREGQEKSKARKLTRQRP